MKNRMKKFFMRYATGTFTLLVFILSLGEELCLGQDMEYANRVKELMNQGYSGEVACDQAEEEFNGRDGLYGTGGIDGKLLHETKPAKPACEHEWTSEITKEPTCTEEGVMTYTCSKCGKTYTEKIAKLEHDYILVETSEATCLVPATETYKCTVCGDTMTKEGAYGEHVLVKDTEKSVEPTCTENGHYVSVCSVCGEVVEEDVEALGHTFPTTKTVIKEPTCTEDGLKAYVCERCGEVKQEEVITATGHDKDTELTITKEATFFTDGTGQYLCKNCGEVMETVVIKAKGGIFRFILPCILVLGIITVVIVLIVRRKK